jgi:hypothetical protein
VSGDGIHVDTAGVGVLDEGVEERGRWARAGRSLLAAVAPGDVVSLHWDWVCDHLTPEQRDQLQRRTTDQLTLTNATATAQES